MEAYFPGKRLDHWLLNENTKQFIDVLQKDNTREVGDYKVLKTKRGKGGGTWAHKHLAFKFAMWLSPEFELHVIKAYETGTQKKDQWNIKRVMAAANFTMMTDSIKEHLADNDSYAYSTEADLLNMIVFGKSVKGIRDTATEAQLDAIAGLEARNSTLIEIGWTYDQRKVALKEMFTKYVEPKMISFKSEI
jgi:hypothetical protein